MIMSVSTILDYLSKDNFKLLYIGIILISVFSLGFAYYVEYVMGIEPCPLCIYQRFPYLYLIKLAVAGLLIKKISKYTLFSIMITLVIACTLAGYHMGVERGVFQPSELCANILHIPEHFNIHDVKKMLYDAPVASCTRPGYKIFGISMTEWNLALNFGILTAAIISYLFSRYHAKTIV
jgi:disulfide bond formation protein DsbB